MVGSSCSDGIGNGVFSDIFIDNMDIFDFPMESLEGDDLDGGDWDSKLQGLGLYTPEALLNSSLPGNATSHAVPSLSFRSEESSELKPLGEAASEASMVLPNDYSDGLQPIVNQALSPMSTLKSSSSCSGEKSMSTSSEALVPVSTHSKQSKSSSINSCLLKPPNSSTLRRSHRLASSKALSRSSYFSDFYFPNTVAYPDEGELQKRKKVSQRPHATLVIGHSSERSIGRKKCSHCETMETPQWREGPKGPNTLCNACGIRYRSGRLLPEYRPAASPTFVPSLHSNSHAKAVEMREKVSKESAICKIEPLMPQSSHYYEFNCSGSILKPMKRKLKKKLPQPMAVQEANVSETERLMLPPKAILEGAIAETEPPMPPPKASQKGASAETEPPIPLPKDCQEGAIAETKPPMLPPKLVQEAAITETESPMPLPPKTTEDAATAETELPMPRSRDSQSNLPSKMANHIKRNPKKRKLPNLSGDVIQQSIVATKKCLHCGLTKTPQWREGPMGPKTLCNACGIRYSSGRLFPEYRPAASPTFVPSLHSNSHRMVVEMRKRSTEEATAVSKMDPQRRSSHWPI